MIKSIILLLLLVITPYGFSQPPVIVVPPRPSATAIHSTTTTTTAVPNTALPTESPGGTVTVPSAPATAPVIVSPNPNGTTATTVSTPAEAIPTPSVTITPVVTPSPPETSTPPATITATTTTSPVNIGPDMMFDCSGTDPNWHLDMTSSGMHFTAPSIATTFSPVLPISTPGAMQGSILVYRTATHDNMPTTVVISKNDMGCRAAPGGTSKIDAYIVLTNRVFVGCCMPK